MTSKPALTPKAAAHLANMIERTERRGAILADLVHVCETLSKKLARDMLDGPFHPESRHDTARAFDVVTRSLRLTLAMEDRVDRQLFALHNGELPVAPARRKEAGEDTGAPAVSAAVEPEPRRSADSESDDREHEAERRESETERLVEYDRFDLTDIDANVEAIQANIERVQNPPSPEVGRADSRLQGGSRVGGERGAGGPGDTCENDNHEHRDVPPPGSGLQARVRPPHFGGGRDEEMEPPWPPGSG